VCLDSSVDRRIHGDSSTKQVEPNMEWRERVRPSLVAKNRLRAAPDPVDFYSDVVRRLCRKPEKGFVS
jgi:hypothetical protein